MHPLTSSPPTVARLAVGWVLVCAMMAGCDGADTDGASDAALPHAPPADTTALRLASWIGPDTAPWPAEDPVVALDVAPDGTLLVARASGRIAWFDAAGSDADWRPVRDGSGEALRPIAAAALSDGGYAVRDSSALHVFAARDSTTPAWSRPVPGRPGQGGKKGVFEVADGRIATGIQPAFPPDGSDIVFPRDAFALWSRDGVVEEVLSIPELVVEGCPGASDPHFASGWFEDLRVRYVPRATWALLPDGSIVAGCPKEYAFWILGSDSLRVAREWSPLRASDKERIGFMNSWIARKSLELGEGASWDWKGEHVPTERPAYADIRAGSDGSIWIRPTLPGRPLATPPTWPLAGLPDTIWTEPDGGGGFDVWSADGTAVEHLRLAPEMLYSPWPDVADPVLRGDTVWAMARDSLGVQRPARFHTTKEGSRDDTP